MDSFLHNVASDLLQDKALSTERLTIVMPSKRARVFFTSAIGDLFPGKAMWQPIYRSIDDLMGEISSLILADRFRLIVELYKVYSRFHKEDFDHFYHWGDVLLSDFDTIDNYMVDAKLLFANISDLKEIEERFAVEFTGEQRKAISSFWDGFLASGRGSDQKDRFISIWSTLYDIYTQYNQQLESQGIGYKGMIYRKAAELLKGAAQGEYFSDTRYAVVGFNALSTSEKELFRYLKRSGSALFYWDVDNYFIGRKSEESAQFVRSNISLFGQELDSKYRSNYLKDKDITVVEAPSQSVQCRYATSFLSECQGHGSTAVVLTDERMLMPLLYSMPEGDEPFNVTLGYGLRNTPAYTLIEALIRLQRQSRVGYMEDGVRFNHRDIEAILHHPYIDKLVSEKVKTTVSSAKQLFYNPSLEASDELLRAIFVDITTVEDMQGYLANIVEMLLESISDSMACEALSLVLETIIKVNGIIAISDIELSLAVYLSLLRKHLASVELAFVGEPLIGTQIMGILESRNVDFDNVLILSVEEDHFPGKLSDRSFVPYNIKRGFNLPTISDHEAMYAYYFFRLLYRAKRVDILYCSTPEGLSTGEPSRYIRQIEYDSPHNITRRRIDVSIRGSEATGELSKAKDEEVMAELGKYLDGRRTLSPSSIYRYIECPYMFYLQDIYGIKVADELDEDLDAAGFGLAMHSALEQIYTRYSYDKLSQVTASVIEAYVDSCLEEQMQLPRSEFGGKILSLRSFVVEYIRSVVDYDINSGLAFKLLGTEKKIKGEVGFEVDGGAASVTVKGSVDRVDLLPSGSVRLIDFKSGAVGKQLDVKSMESLFSVGSSEVKKPPFQVMLYAMIMGGDRLLPALYFARSMRSEKYSPYLTIEGKRVSDYSEVKDQFEQSLKGVLSDIFSSSVPFQRCENRRLCSYCNFSGLCGR